MRHLYYFKAFLVLLGITLIEPIFEVLFLFLHNFVFLHIANIQFSGVSIASLLAITLGFPFFSVFQQYLLMIPVAFALALCIAIFRVVGSVSLSKMLKMALIILVLIALITFLKTFHLMHWSEPVVFLSYLLSSLYWLSSVTLTWLILCLFAIL